MGKQPAAGQKKTKEAIARAAQAKKGGKKKWSKGRTKDKIDNGVFLLASAADKVTADPHKIGKVISIATVSEKLKINGSVAKCVIRQMQEKQVIKKIATTGQSWVYTPAFEKKAAATTQATTSKKGKK